MPKSEDQNKIIRDKTREKIVRAATEIFCNQGFAASGIKEIAECAGISTGLLYRHFSSKEELFRSIISQAVEGLEGLTAVFKHSQTPKETFLSVANEILQELNDTEFIHLNMMITQGLKRQGDALYGDILNNDKRMIEAAAELIKQGQEKGEIKQGDPLTKSAVFFSVFQGLVSFKFMFSDLTFNPTIEELTSMLF